MDGHNLINQSFLKMDMTNEKLKLNVASIQSEFKDQYRDFFAYLCNELEDNGKCDIPTIDLLRDKDVSMYNFFKHKNITSIYAVSINDALGYPIGFIMLNFLEGDYQDINQIHSCLNDKKIKIETLLSLN